MFEKKMLKMPEKRCSWCGVVLKRIKIVPFFFFLLNTVLQRNTVSSYSEIFDFFECTDIHAELYCTEILGPVSNRNTCTLMLFGTRVMETPRLQSIERSISCLLVARLGDIGFLRIDFGNDSCASAPTSPLRRPQARAATNTDPSCAFCPLLFGIAVYWQTRRNKTEPSTFTKKQWSHAGRHRWVDFRKGRPWRVHPNESVSQKTDGGETSLYSRRHSHSVRKPKEW